jgi:hypothetical protein
MTAFNAATQVPASVNGLAKSVGWSCGAYYSLYKEKPYQESEGADLVPLITMQDGLAANKTERVIIRVSLEMAPNWRTSPQPFWVNIIEPSTADIPPDYLP